MDLIHRHGGAGVGDSCRPGAVECRRAAGRLVGSGATSREGVQRAGGSSLPIAKVGEEGRGAACLGK